MANVEREDSGVPPKTIRLNRFLALAGVGARRSNDELIASGAVKINGKVVRRLGVKVDAEKDRVVVNGRLVHLRTKFHYILFNKPKDCITTLSDEKGRTTVLDYVKVRERVFPVGRLDRNTTGVLILTNDGDLTQALLHPEKEIERVYRVRLDRRIEDGDIRKLRRGVLLQDGLARVRDVVIHSGTKRRELYVSLAEGRTREVRRLFEALRYDVNQLERVAFAGLTRRGLPRGRWRFLTRAEIKHLKQQAGLLQKEDIID